MTVFVLDDNEARLAIFRDRFAGYVVVTATSYAAARVLLSGMGRFDIAYLDHHLGDCSQYTGTDVARHIMSMDPLCRPKRVVVHSQLPAGAQEIEAVLRSDPNIIVTREPFRTF